MTEKTTSWSSLEVAKLAVDALTPIVVLWLGYWVRKLSARLTATQWANQKLIEKRLEIFDKVAPLLNDLYCYMMFVGNWKELTPPEMVQAKCSLDKTMYINAALFSPTFIQLYHDFIHICFETFTEAGHNARLKTPVSGLAGDRHTGAQPWQAGWDTFFSPAVSDKCQVKASYEALMDSFAQELGLGLEARSAARSKATPNP